MKYVLIAAIVILAVRVDYWLGLFDKANENLGPTPVEVDTTGITNNREIVGIKQDLSLKQTPKETYLALLEDFRSSPSSQIREKAMMIFKENPTMFNQKLDVVLEASVFRWRDLLNNNDPEAVNFMLDLMNILQGENQFMMKRFFSLWMEINMEHFIAAYSRTRDTNCTIATLFGDSIPEEEKINEYYDREAALKTFLAKEKIEPAQKALATNCLLVLGIEIAKTAPTQTQTPEATPVQDPDVQNTQPVQLTPQPPVQPAGVSP